MRDLYHETDKALSSAKRSRVLTYGDDVDKLLLALFDAVGELIGVPQSPDDCP